MEKILTLILLIPFLAFSQQKPVWKQIRDGHRIADTMHFPSPFEFKYIDTVPLSKSALYNKCFQWISTITNNTKRGLQIQDSLIGKLVLTNVESGANRTSETITIDVKDGKYRLTVNNFSQQVFPYDLDLYESIDSIKDTKSLRWDKYDIMQQNEAVVKSLKEYVRKKDDNF
jgi:hypothetical protein